MEFIDVFCSRKIVDFFYTKHILLTLKKNCKSIMKKVFLMLGLLLGFAAQQHAVAEAPITQPDPGKEYYVVHSSGMLLSQKDDKLRVISAGKNDQQVWKFEDAGADSYYVKNVASGQYLGSDNAWTATFANTPAEMAKGEDYAKWEFPVSYLDDYITLKNVGRGAYAGTDDNNEDTGVYTNKGGNDGKHLWRIIEKTGNVFTLALDQQIEAAEALLEKIGTNVGAAHGQYAAAAVDALKASLTAAKAAKNGTSQDAVNDAVDDLKAKISACSAARNIVLDLTKKYAFKQQASGYVLGLNASNVATLQSFALSSTQVYTFEAVDGEAKAFNFKNNGDAYIGKSTGNDYDITGHEAIGENTKFAIELCDVDADGVSWYYIYNVKRGGYVASDNVNENAGIYCDKSKNVRGIWAFTEVDESNLITTALESAIENAKATLAGKPIGTDPGNYPQAAVDALNAAIATAEAALAAKESQTAVNEATDALIAATNKFLNSKVVFAADPTKQYYLMQEASSLILTISSNIAKIDNPQGLDAQKFRLIAAEEGSTSIYNLQLANGTDYLIRQGGWDTSVGTDPTVDVAKWRFQIKDLEKGYYLLQKFESTSGNYFGTDSNTPGSIVYTNKGDNANGHWKIIEVVEGQAFTAVLEKNIETATNLLAGAEVGTEPGQYPQAAIDALTTALQAAKTADTSTQESVNAASDALQEAINAFNAAKILPWFRAEAGVKYRFSTNKYETKYMTNVDGSAKTTAAYTVGEAGQHWTVEEVDATNHVYVVKNGDLYLNYDGTVTAPASAAEAPKWRTVYTNTRNNIDYFALAEDENPTKVVAFSSGNTWAIQDLSTTNTAHQGRFMRVDPVNDSNLGALEIAIATAQAALDGVNRGPAIGQYSDAKCEAFQALINTAKTYYSGKTQAEVDAEVTALNKARTDFINNPNMVIRDELDAALAKLDSIAQNAVIGIEVGQFMWSQIDAMKAKHAAFVSEGSQISEQEPCDSLTATVLAYIESDCKGHAAKQEVSVVLNDAIACAEAIYEAEKDNVGTDMGQRSQEVVNAFRDAIATAKAVTDPDVADLEALLDAYDAFNNGAVSVDRTALRKAIASAQDEKYSDLVAGEYDGMYPQEKIDDFTAALANAVAVEADMTKTQEEVNAATKSLNDARTALDGSKITIVFTALDATIEKAEATAASVTEIGDEEGKCPQSVVDTFNSVLTEAKGIDRAAIVQADVDTMNIKLTEAIDTFKVAVKESTGIIAAIDSAREVLDEAVVGFKPGNYPKSAVAGLQNAIAVAEEAEAAEELSQANLIAAVKELNEAVDAFKAEVILDNDLAELERLISIAESAVASGLNDNNVKLALLLAKDGVANPNDYTQSEIDALAEDLKLALQYAGVDTDSLRSIAAGARISLNGAGISIDGIDGEYSVTAYAADGRVVASAQACDGAVNMHLASGCYIVVVRGENVNIASTVLVK